MYLRLRQICLVAGELAPAEKKIIDVLGLEVCFRDTGVAKYGLHNALFTAGGTFLEVVSPTKDGTAAGRYIERRKGDGGYMFIVDCDDLEARRAHFQKLGVRIVEDLVSAEGDLKSEALHLHPRDTGGCLLSVDRHSGGTNMMGGYKWAGPGWQSHDRSKTMTSIIGAGMQSENPEATAKRWSELLQRPMRKADVKTGGDPDSDYWQIDLDKGFARFGPLRDDRGEGLRSVHFACKDKAAVLSAAKAAGAPSGEDYVDLIGVRFVLA
jgi:hypothetical protein